MWHDTPDAPSPWQFLLTRERQARYGSRKLNDYESIQLLFVTDPILTHVAMRIAASHLRAYAEMVLADYILLFAPLSTSGGEMLFIQQPASRNIGRNFDELSALEKMTYFPPNGTIDMSRPDEKVRLFMASFSDRYDVFLVLQSVQRALQPLLIHLLLITSGITLLIRKNRYASITSVNLRLAATTVFMLGVTAMSLNAVVSLVELPLSRYALAAEVPMNIILSLATCASLALIGELLLPMASKRSARA